MMRKFLALVISVLLIASLSITAFAAVDSTTGSGTDSGTVTVNVKASDGTDMDEKKVYSVEMSWAGLEFTFTSSVAKNELTWDDENHKYSNLAGSWSEKKTVTVINHSNAGISVAAAFSNQAKRSEENLGVIATLTNGDANLASAAGTTGASVPQTSYDVHVEGIPYTLDAFVVDTITATISPWDGQ